MSILPYADTVYAFDYFSDRLNSALWFSTSDGDRITALKTATRYIDGLNFAGEKHDETYDPISGLPNQPLQFPRGNDTVVPDDIMQACCELAFKLLDDVDAEIEFENIGANMMGIGDAKISRDTRVTPEHILAGIPSLRAWNLLKPYLRAPGHAVMLRDS